MNLKRWALVLCAAAAAVLLTGCGAQKEETGKGTADDAPASLLEKVNMVAEDAAGLAPLTAEDLEDVLGIVSEDCRDFVFLQSAGTDGREILVVLAADADAAKRVAEMAEAYLERRLDETRNYAPEAYRLLTQAKVQARNLTVALVVGPDAAKEAEAILSGN